MRLRGIKAESGVVYPRGLRYFFEVSPRPHDTGLVSLISQNLSQFALHARAILGLPIPSIDQFGPSASAVIMGEGQSQATRFSDVDKALSEPGTAIRLFGKPDISGSRHLGVSVASAETIVEARKKACTSAQAIRVQSE